MRRRWRPRFLAESRFIRLLLTKGEGATADVYEHLLTNSRQKMFASIEIQ
jgi:hypothetical protein